MSAAHSPLAGYPRPLTRDTFPQASVSKFCIFFDGSLQRSRVKCHFAIMSGPPRASKSSESPSTTSRESSAWESSQGEKHWEYKDCISCRIVGTGALGLTGLYALRMARPQAPGSFFGKMMMAGIGVGESTYSLAPPNSMPYQYMAL